MPNTMPFQHHTASIEQNELHRLKKIFSKFRSKMLPYCYEKQYVLYIQNLCLLPYLTSMQCARVVFYYHLFRV